ERHRALDGRDLRVRLLQVVPLARLTIALAVIVYVVPRVIAPTTQNVIALLGAVGIAVGFALKDYVGSLVAGIVAITEAPYRQGDWVRIGSHYGEVRSVGIRAIEIVTLADDVVTVPHGVLWTDEIANANDGERSLMVVTDVWVAPDHDAAAVGARLRDVLWTSPWLDVRRPVAVVLRDEPWGSRYQLKGYPLEARDQVAFRSDLVTRAKTVLRAMGVRFARPPGADASSRFRPDASEGRTSD
ncbi:MAG: mechanosensitive ion channel domain-containing protein, partial [Trueperaceae bacterium]